jgi:hypothetical protein
LSLLCKIFAFIVHHISLEKQPDVLLSSIYFIQTTYLIVQVVEELKTKQQ